MKLKYEIKSITEANEDSSSCLKSLAVLGCMSKSNPRERQIVNRDAKLLNKSSYKKSINFIKPLLKESLNKQTPIEHA